MSDEEPRLPVLTAEQKAVFETWVKAHVNAAIVPADEGNGDALVYNLVHAIRGDNRRYNYEPDQDDELRAWGLWRD